ncbi:MAG: type II toxin-antitoxin system HicA family toxin [Elusimicrobia bacterium]|nr:type II toxin-antitoxin system HicA family toxin [Elusimicrobiota bacterium]
MPKLPPCRSREVIAALRRAGFRVDHHTGGHAILYKEGHPHPVTVPEHPGDLKMGTLRRIVKDAGLSIPEFVELL